MDIKTLVNDEITSEIEEISKIEVGTEKHTAAVNAVVKLMDKSIELEKLQNEKLEKKDARETEYDLKMVEMQHDRIDRIVKNTLTGLATVGGFGVAIWGTLMSLKFEEKGVVTTISGRSFIQSLLHPLK